MSGNAVIRTENLRKSFGNTAVLNGVNLEIQEGQIVGLLGSNGSGKTTLLKCLLGLLKTDSGISQLLGEPSWDLTAAAKENLGYVPQEVVLMPWMTVGDTASYTGAFYEHWQPKRVERLLTQGGIDAKKSVGELSVGQRQKLASILAMGHDPRLLILDEPVASLDPVARRQFLQELIDLAQDEQHTVLFSTHITSDVERVASHVAILVDGQVEYFGELDELKDRIKRVRLTLRSSSPQNVRCPEAIRSVVDGNHWLLSIDQTRVDIDTLSERYDADVRVEDLNLEEIFIEICGQEVVASVNHQEPEASLT
ncbi:MAG: ABC transporter ATP-binding protein [Planctomycetaceae bacterium]|nr:ABC transporter ATP-binding protein [Planctomycetaceae bacterium]